MKRTDRHVDESWIHGSVRCADAEPPLFRSVVILTIGLWTMKTKNRNAGQTMMRARVLAQGATVSAMVAGLFYHKFK